MAIVQTVVRVSGGLVVAVFQYMADMDLYRLMVVDGTAQVLRDGELTTVNQTDVVPGKYFWVFRKFVLVAFLRIMCAL